jgi:16S rRNA (guanine527-N7)-methyltransferase
VVNARAEAWEEGLGAQDLVAARALAPLAVILEYAAPLLALEGVLVAWKGRLEPAEKGDGRAAAAALGMSAPEIVPVEPSPDAHDRYLYLSSKVSPTPPTFPRRPGTARKRPLRASG